MYKIRKNIRTQIHSNNTVEGESIERMIERMMNNDQEEQMEGKELLYTRPEDGIIAAFDIRHDHWDDAVEGASTMAEKRKELDSAQLEKRKKLLKQKEEEEKFLQEQAKKGMADNSPKEE